MTLPIPGKVVLVARPNTASKVKRTLQAIFRELGGGGARFKRGRCGGGGRSRPDLQGGAQARGDVHFAREANSLHGVQAVRLACYLLVNAWWLRWSHVELSRCWCGANQRLPACTLGGRGSVPRFGTQVWWSQGRASLPQRLLAMPRLLSSNAHTTS